MFFNISNLHTHYCSVMEDFKELSYNEKCEYFKRTVNKLKLTGNNFHVDDLFLCIKQSRGACVSIEAVSWYFDHSVDQEQEYMFIPTFAATVFPNMGKMVSQTQQYHNNKFKIENNLTHYNKLDIKFIIKNVMDDASHSNLSKMKLYSQLLFEQYNFDSSMYVYYGTSDIFFLPTARNPNEIQYTTLRGAHWRCMNHEKNVPMMKAFREKYREDMREDLLDALDVVDRFSEFKNCSKSKKIIDNIGDAGIFERGSSIEMIVNTFAQLERHGVDISQEYKLFGGKDGFVRWKETLGCQTTPNMLRIDRSSGGTINKTMFSWKQVMTPSSPQYDGIFYLSIYNSLVHGDYDDTCLGVDSKNQAFIICKKYLIKTIMNMSYTEKTIKQESYEPS